MGLEARRTDNDMTPPRLTASLLGIILGDGVVGLSILGDLREEFGRRAERDGRPRARWWYRREALSVCVRAFVQRVRGRTDWDRREHSASAKDGMRGDAMFLQSIRELRSAVRALARSPGFATVTVITLALAIGANASIFSVVNGVLLKPLPFPDPDRLVVFRSSAPGINAPDQFGVSPEMKLQYQEAQAIEDLGLYMGFDGTLVVNDGVDRLPMARVTGSFFTTLGVQPLLGRLATDEELAAPPEDRPAIISHALWQTQFGSDPGIVNRSADIDGSTRDIIGVMGPEFRFPDDDVAVWIPYSLDPDNVEVGQFMWNLVGRMKEGVGTEDVLRQVTPLARRLEEDYASFAQYVTFLQQGQYRPFVGSLKEQLLGDLNRPLWILLGTVGFVFLIACANVANLFLVRAESRQRDMAVRAALGSGRGRLIRTHMAEALVLAVLGGLVGILHAWVGVPVLLQAAPDGIPRLQDVRLDATVLAFTAGASLLAALLFGLLPAVRYSSPRLLTRLRYAGRGAAGGQEKHFARNALVVVQSGLALVLLVGSGLLVRSFWELKNTDPGFETDGILTFQYALSEERYPSAQDKARFHTSFLDELKGIPGVISAGAVVSLPIDQQGRGTAWEIEGAPTGDGELDPVIFFNYASPNYFGTMEIMIEAGRDFDNSDHENPWGAAIVSRGMADKYWPGQDPIGKRFRIAGNTTDWETVVGMVEDVRSDGLRNPAPEMIYLPFVTRGARGNRGDIVNSPSFAVRAENPEQLIPVIRQRLNQADASLPMYRVQTMETIVENSVVRLSFTMLTLGIASAMALLLGAVGLYGVLSYLVTQRTQEIGVRLALGAQSGQVRRMVVLQGARLVAAGMVVGLLAAFGLAGLLQGLLYGTEPLDPMTFAAMSGVMLVVGMVASYLPARRASSVDPLESMRLE